MNQSICPRDPFPDIPAVSAEILALRGWEGEKRRAASVRAVALGAAPLGLGSVGFEIRLLRRSSDHHRDQLCHRFFIRQLFQSLLPHHV